MTSFLPISPVSLVNGKPATTSLAIAEHFGKRHDSVMRDIRNIKSNCPEEFNAHNFVAVKYTDAKGEERDSFTVFFDGFILLAMGYTGKQALQIKLVYIAAFNAMRETLTNTSPCTPPHITTTDLTITADQQCTLQAMVRALVEKGGIYAQIWSRFNNHFRLPRYSELPQSRMTEAIQYLMGLDLEPEQKALPPAPTFDVMQRRRELDAALYGVSEALRHFTADFNQAIPHKAYPHAPRKMNNAAKLVDSALESIGCQIEVATRAVHVAMDVFEDVERRL